MGWPIWMESMETHDSNNRAQEEWPTAFLASVWVGAQAESGSFPERWCWHDRKGKHTRWLCASRLHWSLKRETLKISYKLATFCLMCLWPSASFDCLFVWVMITAGPQQDGRRLCSRKGQQRRLGGAGHGLSEGEAWHWCCTRHDVCCQAVDRAMALEPFAKPPPQKKGDTPRCFMMLCFDDILLHKSWWLLNASYFFTSAILYPLAWNSLGSWAVSQGWLWKQSRMVQARCVISLRHDFDALSFHVLSVVSAVSPSFSSSKRLYMRKVLPRLSSLERNWARGDINEA